MIKQLDALPAALCFLDVAEVVRTMY